MSDYPVAAFRVLRNTKTKRPERRLSIRLPSLASMERWLERTTKRRKNARHIMWIEEEWRPAVIVAGRVVGRKLGWQGR